MAFWPKKEVKNRQTCNSLTKHATQKEYLPDDEEENQDIIPSLRPEYKCDVCPDMIFYIPTLSLSIVFPPPPTTPYNKLQNTIPTL